MKITWQNLPCVLRNILAIIRNTTGLYFVLKRIGQLAPTIYFHCYLLVLALFTTTKIPKRLPFSGYSETLLKTIYQHLLLLVGFDTLTYRKCYDRSPAVVGHQCAILMKSQNYLSFCDMCYLSRSIPTITFPCGYLWWFDEFVRCSSISL